MNTFLNHIEVLHNLSNYATQTDLKEATEIDTCKFLLKSNLAGSKTEVDKIDVDKLKTVPVDLSKLSNVVNNDVVRKTVYNKLVTNLNNINTTGFVLKTKYDTDKSDLKTKLVMKNKKTPNTSGLVKKHLVLVL